MNVKSLLTQNSKIIFAQNQQGEEVFHSRDLVQLFPYGISVSPLPVDAQRPVLLLKDQAHEYTLPVPINPLEAGMVVAQNNRQAPPLNPHRFTEMLLEQLDIQICQCVFIEIRGVHQYVRLYTTGNPKMSSFKVRAEEAMSLALIMGIPLYATKSFIERSKVLAAEIESGQANEQILARPIVERNQNYIM